MTWRHHRFTDFKGPVWSPLLTFKIRQAWDFWPMTPIKTNNLWLDESLSLRKMPILNCSATSGQDEQHSEKTVQRTPHQLEGRKDRGSGEEGFAPDVGAKPYLWEWNLPCVGVFFSSHLGVSVISLLRSNRPLDILPVSSFSVNKTRLKMDSAFPGIGFDR